MPLVLHQPHRISAVRYVGPRSLPTTLRKASIACKSSPVDYALSLPPSFQNAKYRRELEAAIDVVERACNLCVDVKRSLFSSEESRIMEKNDRTPVTVADFGVQALISLDLGKQFPSIPLVGEEDSSSIRATSLVDSVTNAVAEKAAPGDQSLTKDAVLKAIDRGGGKGAASFGIQPATYWILDPIDGTRGFLKGSESLYVVGLALVVGGEIVLGVMGCPNWRPNISDTGENEVQDGLDRVPRLGLIMISHTGCGTWTKWLSDMLDSTRALSGLWTRSLVDGFSSVPEGHFCIPESQTWESLPLSASFKSTTAETPQKEDEIVLLQACCGSLCKYMMVASGRASVFFQRVKPKATIKAWDHAAGMIFVLEAGGKVTDWEGIELDIAVDISNRRTLCPNGGVLVTNGSIHNEILTMISAGYSTPASHTS